MNDNGSLSFGRAVASYYFQISTFTNTVMIAPFWADLISPGDIYIAETSDSVTFRWERVYWGNQSSTVNFSVTLHRNGEITFAYGNGNVNGGYVGISAGDGGA